MTHTNPNAAGFKSKPRRSCVARTFWKFRLLPRADTDEEEAHFRLLPTLGEEEEEAHFRLLPTLGEEEEEGTTAAQSGAAEDIA
jgi:hypothetical protein|tara:strand:- start:58 stop:309 length:252 start_codon:yes stop_codon:yes gene_type:complete